MDPSEPQPTPEESTPEGTAPWTPQPGTPDPFAEHPAAHTPATAERRSTADDDNDHAGGAPASPAHPAADETTDPAPPSQTFTATTAPGDPSRSGSGVGPKRATQIGATLAVATAAFLILGLWKPGFLNTTKLDVTIAQRSIEQLLTDPANGYGLSAVSNVTCNNGQNPTVRAGATFTCTLRISGTPRQVSVTFDNSSGDYTVSPPQ